MKYPERVKTFRKVKTEYIGFLTSVLWKLTGDRELFVEAMQYSLLSMWRHVEKLNGRKAKSYIYRIALTANSTAWRNRIGRNGQFNEELLNTEGAKQEKTYKSETEEIVRRAISKLPLKQSRAIVMRYLEEQDYKNIAFELKCSEAGARSHVSKAIATLRRKLSNG